MKQLKKKKGFTLVELIVVIAIIAILAAVAVPTTMHFVEKAHESNDEVAINILGNINAMLATDATNLNSNSRSTNKLINALEADTGAKAALKRIQTITLSVDGEGNITATILSDSSREGNEAKTNRTVEGIVATGATNSGLSGNTTVYTISDKGEVTHVGSAKENGPVTS